ncbi:MAG: hypothetical protein VX211_02655 [Pseudomonadota bacterium]|nr:hypothetical protein [Pseudomonadota bacterium]
MVFNETILGAIIIGVLVGGAILYSNSKSSLKLLATGDDIDVGQVINEALQTKEGRRIIIRKELNTGSGTREEQPKSQSAEDANEVRVELRLDGSTLEPAEIAQKIEEAVRSGLQQLPFDIEVNISAGSG